MSNIEVVRLAAASDEDTLMDLLRQKHEEDGIGSFDEAKARYVLRRGIRRDGGLVGVIRQSSGAVKASIGLYIDRGWDTSDEHLLDRWVYVCPDARRSTYAKSLLEFAKWAAIQLGRPLVATALITEDTANKEKLYHRHFAKASGTVFIFVPPTIAAA